MAYSRFVLYNILGAFLWTSLFVFGGYFFGNIPIVKQNFEIVVVGIVLISVVPMGIEYIRGRTSAIKAKPSEVEETSNG